MRIVEIDPADDGALRAFWEVEQAAMIADRAHPVLRTFESLAMARTPSPYYRQVLLAAVDGETTVGVATLGCSVGDNEHLADLEVDVVPTRRREGIGRSLYDAAAVWCRDHGRTTVVGEAHTPIDGPPDGAASYAFARAMGAQPVHAEEHFVLDLPASPPPAGPADGWEIVTWRNHCPEEYAAAYCAMRTQMENDVPRGEVDYEPFVFDEVRMRTGEERIARLYHQVVAAARRTSDGAFGGYSLVYLPFGQSDVIQDDTLVMPEHRGRRLGTLMKQATLEIVQREHPDRRTLHTWTAVDNHPMQRTNRDFGYRPVERLHEMQRRGL